MFGMFNIQGSVFITLTRYWILLIYIDFIHVVFYSFVWFLPPKSFYVFSQTFGAHAPDRLRFRGGGQTRARTAWDLWPYHHRHRLACLRGHGDRLLGALGFGFWYVWWCLYCCLRRKSIYIYICVCVLGFFWANPFRGLGLSLTGREWCTSPYLVA